MIAITYTTFLRDELMMRTVVSIIKNLPEGHDFTLLVGDQSPTDEKARVLGPLLREKAAGEYIPLPFDCGLSEARNRLISRAYSMGCSFSVVTADSIEFMPETIQNIPLAVRALGREPGIDLLGFDILNRLPWEFNLSIGKKDEDRFFEISEPDDVYPDPETGITLVTCDICRNFFIATTASLYDVRWDESLKLAEHEDFFWRYKMLGYSVAWTPDVYAQYVENRPEEYAKYRYRYNQFQSVLMEKYGLTQWLRRKEKEVTK